MGISLTGASQSKPHTSELNCAFFIYMYTYIIYTPLYPCFCGNSWVLYSIYWQEVVDSVDSVDSGIYTPEVVKRMLPISYLVYSENYNVYLLITTRDKSEWRINHSRQEFMFHKQPTPSGSGGLLTLNSCLLWFIYYILYICCTSFLKWKLTLF